MLSIGKSLARAEGHGRFELLSRCPEAALVVEVGISEVVLVVTFRRSKVYRKSDRCDRRLS